MPGWLTDRFQFLTFGHSGVQALNHSPHFGTESQNGLTHLALPKPSVSSELKCLFLFLKRTLFTNSYPP